MFFNIVLPVFVIVACGYLLQKRSDIDMETLTRVSLFVCTPALVFTSLVGSEADYSLGSQIALFMLLYTLVLWGLAILLAKLLGFDSDTARALVLTTAMMNVGNFGLPLVYFAFGEQALTVSVVTFVVFNIPLGTLAVFLAQGNGANWKTALTNVGRNPIFYAVAAAALYELANLPQPDWLIRPLDLLGQAAIPLLLILLGAQLARTNWQASFGFLSLSSFLRLAVAPLLAFLLCRFLRIDGLTAKILILQTSTPAAILPLVYALHYRTRPDLVAGAITVSTLLSAPSLTVLLYLL